MKVGVRFRPVWSIAESKGIGGVKHHAGFCIHLLVYAKKLTKVGWLDRLSNFMLRARGADIDGPRRENEEGVYLVTDLGR